MEAEERVLEVSPRPLIETDWTKTAYRRLHAPVSFTVEGKTIGTLFSDNDGTRIWEFADGTHVPLWVRGHDGKVDFALRIFFDDNRQVLALVPDEDGRLTVWSSSLVECVEVDREAPTLPLTQATLESNAAGEGNKGVSPPKDDTPDSSTPIAPTLYCVTSESETDDDPPKETKCLALRLYHGVWDILRYGEPRNLLPWNWDWLRSFVSRFI